MTDAPTQPPQVSTTPSPLPLTAMPKEASFRIDHDYNRNNSFGACMMWMDDTERLIEWIAYHYHTLPLRRLVIYRDPKSTRELTQLFDRWRPYMNMTIWTSLDQFPHYSVKPILASIKDKPMGVKMIVIQKKFVRNCLKQLQDEKWTWTFVGDPDEFLVLSSNVIPNSAQMMKRPGIIMEVLKGARATKRIPLTEKSLSQQQMHRWGDPTTRCMCLGRRQFGGFESPYEAVAKDVPHIFDPYRFQTLRFRHHRRKGVICKSIVDVSGVQINGNVWMSHHRTFKDICGDNWGRKEDLMHVHHHFGSWELYERPNDRRGGKEKAYEAYQKKNAWVMGSMRSDQGDESRQWLGGFVEHFGEEKALELLADVGSPYNNETALETIVAATRDGIVRPVNVIA